MKRLLMALLLSSAAVPALADVGVSIQVGEPNFYGVINIGEAPEPRFVYPQPVLVERVAVAEEPLYLRVPPGHAKHWSQHCYEYHACGRRVYFVDDRWYHDVYVPHYRERYEHHEERREGRYDDRHDHDYDRDHGHGHGDYRDHGQGHGDDHDHGHGHGHDYDRDDERGHDRHDPSP